MDSNIIKIPSTNSELDDDLSANKEKYMDFIFEKFIELLKLQEIPKQVKIFKFDKTELHVIVKSSNYLSNIDNLLNYYIKKEEYEKCNKLTKLKNRIVDTN